MTPYGQNHHLSGAPVSVDDASIGMYSRLLTPVVLVTEARGREVFTHSRRLFARLAQIGETLRGENPPPRAIMAIWQGDQHVADSGVLALELMLELNGLENFNRASKAQRGPARAVGTKYQWSFLGEYLGWEWQRS